MDEDVLPGDVVLVRTRGWVGAAIRFGAALLGRPNLHSHVAIMHHVDAAGVPWGIEGRPGGVGWVDMADYLADSHSTSNNGQPKTADQRTKVAEVAYSLLKVPYDWSAIARDVLQALRLDRLWHAKDYGDKSVPGALICSALADYTYAKVGLASPGVTDGDGIRFTTPADWDVFIETKAWLKH
jgi:hypothetical protein